MERRAKQDQLRDDPDRADRSSEDAARAAPRVMASQDFQEMLNNEWVQQILPDAPKINGWHCCWLSTTNQYDTVQWRKRIGYVPVTLEEAPEMKNFQVHSGDFDGLISCNEMLLFKIKEERYQQLMRHFHHTMPQDEATKIRANVDKLKDEAKDSEGGDLLFEEGEGMADMVRAVKAPKAFE